MVDPFETADYYDACASEVVNHTCPEDAIDEFVNWGEWDEDMGPIEVTAYVVHRDEPWLLRVAERAADETASKIADLLYGEFDDDLADIEADIARAVRADIVRVLRDIGTLREVGKRTYSVAEVLEIVGLP